ncbi:MAG: hypothetical protein ACI376_05735 [Candidatus Bruticola sp.]
MSFWDDLRSEVRDRYTTGDISVGLFSTITSFGVMPLPVVQPTFYMGRCYILCFDYMDYVEKLLACQAKQENVFQLLLYIKETAATLGRCVHHAVGPIEEILSAIDDIFDERMRKLEETLAESIIEEAEEEAADELENESNSDDYDEFKRERTLMAASLQEKFEAVDISYTVAVELSMRLAAMYDCCTRYVRDLRELNSSEVLGEVVIFMRTFIDVQHILDTQMRQLLLEDVFMERSNLFSTGLMPWISHSVGELVHQINGLEHE